MAAPGIAAGPTKFAESETLQFAHQRLPHIAAFPLNFILRDRCLKEPVLQAPDEPLNPETVAATTGLWLRNLN